MRRAVAVMATLILSHAVLLSHAAVDRLYEWTGVPANMEDRVYSSADALPNVDGRLTWHWLLLPEGWSIDETLASSLWPREVGMHSGALGRALRMPACLDKGLHVELISTGGARVMKPEDEDELDAAAAIEWAEHACQRVMFGLINGLGVPVNLTVGNETSRARGPNGQEAVRVGEPGFERVEGKPFLDGIIRFMPTVWLETRLGSSVDVTSRVGAGGPTRHHVRSLVSHNGALVLGGFPPLDPKVRATSREEWVRRATDSEITRRDAVTKSYTKDGWGLETLPAETWAEMSTFYANNQGQLLREDWIDNEASVFVNWWEAECRLVSVPGQFHAKWKQALMPLVSKWAGGIELEPTASYGIRVYTNGSTLMPHVDRASTHVLSVIVHIADSGMRAPWHLQLDDLHGERQRVPLAPGQLLFYESARCMHGRPEPLEGDSYANMFFHFKPKTKSGHMEWLSPEGQASASATGAKVSMLVVSDAARPVDLWWQDTKVDTLQPGRPTRMQGFKGHKIRVRGPGCRERFFLRDVDREEETRHVCAETPPEQQKPPERITGVGIVNGADAAAGEMELYYRGKKLHSVPPGTAAKLDGYLGMKIDVAGACTAQFAMGPTPERGLVLCAPPPPAVKVGFVLQNDGDTTAEIWWEDAMIDTLLPGRSTRMDGLSSQTINVRGACERTLRFEARDAPLRVCGPEVVAVAPSGGASQLSGPGRDAGAAANGADPEDLDDAKWDRLAEQGLDKSRRIRRRLVNTAQVRLRLWWIDERGNEHERNPIEPGQGMVELESSLGHLHRARGEGCYEAIIFTESDPDPIFLCRTAAVALADATRRSPEEIRAERDASVLRAGSVRPYSVHNLGSTPIAMFTRQGGFSDGHVSDIRPGEACATNVPDPSTTTFCIARGGAEDCKKPLMTAAAVRCHSFAAAADADSDASPVAASPVSPLSCSEEDWQKNPYGNAIVYEDGAGVAEHSQTWEINHLHASQYLAATGRPWLRYGPVKPPAWRGANPFREARRVGDVYTVKTTAPLQPAPPSGSTKAADELRLRVASLKPRIFVIDQFLSAEECELLISTGARNVVASTTSAKGGSTATAKGGVSASRTSRNTWVARGASELSERVYRRAADVLGVDHTLLSEDTFLAEHLQLVHYAVGDKYDSHYDWSPKNVTRLCTLLLYLNDPVEGGATSFPRAERSEAEGPLVLHPGKGGAVLFYNLLPDGNADETSLHAALPVIAGEKWIANLWVWDHRRP